jgi:hypothetical protein
MGKKKEKYMLAQLRGPTAPSTRHSQGRHPPNMDWKVAFARRPEFALGDA